MREITITFTLYDEHEERLKKIVEEYKRQHNFVQTESKMFEMIMLTGSKHDIDAKLKFHEWKLGLREDFKQKGVVTMCYKADKHRHLSLTLSEKLKDVPDFISEFFDRYKSAATKNSNWGYIRDLLQWLLEKNYIKR